MKKSIHQIRLTIDSTFTAELKINESGEGYLKYYENNKEIEDSEYMFDNYSRELIKHYMKHADLICRFNNAILWSY